MHTVVLICISNAGFSQSQDIRIRFISNAGLCMTDGHSNIYVDFPYRSGFWIYSKYDKSEIKNIKDSSIFLFTHKHPDHYSIRLVSRMLRKHKGKKYGPWNIDKLEQLGTTIPDFSILAFKTSHNISRRHCSYLITWHSKKIFISGDTEHPETIAVMKDLDWAFVPGWLLNRVIEGKMQIDAKMTGIYHKGPGDKITVNHPKFHLFDKQGEVISIPY